MKIILGGALGRMGQEIARSVRDTDTVVVCGVDVAFHGQPCDFPVVAAYHQVAGDADALIDFSRPDGLPELLALATARKLPSVLCATGYNAEELGMIDQAAKTVPIFRSANMSLGVSVLRRLAVTAAKALGEGYDVEIVEKHHRMKADSPSGTALMLYEAIEKETGSATEPVYGRYGRNAKRAPGEIGIHAIRGGTMTGEHEVGFYGAGEELILTHRAENRSLFVQGALRAARFLLDKPAGRYGMEDLMDDLLR